MSGILITAIVTITLALVFYTIGVWSEHHSKRLKKPHLVFFWLGLCMDTTGTMVPQNLFDLEKNYAQQYWSTWTAYIQ